MASRAQASEGQAAAIVRRISRADAAAEMLAELQARVAGFEHLSAKSQTDIVAGIERTLGRWSRFLLSGEMPPDSDFDALREWTRTRAAEGLRLEDLLRSFGLIHELGWELLRRHAEPSEQEALLDLAGYLAQYLQRVSAIVTETYLAERELLVSEEERRTRTLLERLCADSPLEAADRELAERLDVPLDRAYTPFAVVIPGTPLHRQAALAARLRRSGVRLAVTQSHSVTGLTWTPLDVGELGEGPDVLLVIGRPVARGELAAAREELAMLADHARWAGLRGRIEAEDHLFEIMLGRASELVERLRRRILDPLAQEEHAELARTLRTFVSCRLDRTATSAELHIHRNTLAYRLGRIEQIAGVDLASPRDLACVYVALQAPPAEAQPR